MEASAIRVGPGLERPRLALATPLLRLRSDQQLVALFRAGSEEAFRVIHDRYRPRLLAYVHQMLPGRAADAEDALQEVFLRTYSGLRSSDRDLALRPWLYRVAHNRCVDELRRPVQPELSDRSAPQTDCDPVAATEQREALRRLVVDIRRLPEQQRSALLMRELSGMPYADVADALDISVPAVKSLLVRSRIGLAQALEARDAACVDICGELAEAHDRGVRPSWMARRHLRDCPGCQAFRAQLRVSRRQFAALTPTLGPLALLAKLFGIGTGASGGTASAASAGGAVTAGAGGAAAAGMGGALSTATGFASATVGHVATMLAAAAVTAGGAVELQQTVTAHAGSKPAAPAVHHSSSPATTAPVHTSGQVGGQVAGQVSNPAPAASQAVPARSAPAASQPTPASRTTAATKHRSQGTHPSDAMLALSHPYALTPPVDTSATTTATCPSPGTSCPVAPTTTQAGSTTTSTSSTGSSSSASSSTTTSSGPTTQTSPPSSSSGTVTPS